MAQMKTVHATAVNQMKANVTTANATWKHGDVVSILEWQQFWLDENSGKYVDFWEEMSLKVEKSRLLGGNELENGKKL